MQKATIQTRLPSLNEYIDACRANKYTAAKMKRNAEYEISLFIRKLKRVESPVYITFTWREKDKRRDPDNVAFAKKFIFDALVTRKILPNDNARYVKGFRDAFEYGKDYSVTIEMEEIS